VVRIVDLHLQPLGCDARCSDCKMDLVTRSVGIVEIDRVDLEPGRNRRSPSVGLTDRPSTVSQSSAKRADPRGRDVDIVGDRGRELALVAQEANNRPAAPRPRHSAMISISWAARFFRMENISLLRMTMGFHLERFGISDQSGRLSVLETLRVSFCHRRDLICFGHKKNIGGGDKCRARPKTMKGDA